VRVDIVTIFPELFASPFEESIIRRARDRGLLDLRVHDLRGWTTDRHRVTDDAPFGGGAGMVMKPEPIFGAVENVRSDNERARVLLMTPQGRLFNHSLALALSREEHLILICGRYEGVDERVRDHLATEELSIGDYVLTGGELPALVMLDAVARLIPGAVGDEQSVEWDSFTRGLLDYPHYTRPADFRGFTVPDVLLSGHHEQVRRWRKRQAVARTLARRPELLAAAELDDEERAIVRELSERGQEEIDNAGD
jgi:tRNA (guanine37-N1)-methyltransferase